MSGAAHGPVQDNIDTHPAKVAVLVAVGATALVIGIILLVQFALGAYGSRSLKDDPAMSPEAVAKRLAPVAMLAIDPNAPKLAPAAAAPAVAPAVIPPPAAPASGKSAGGSGKATFDAVCNTCHGTGLAGAPKLGDKAAWAPRLKGGNDALYASALHGKGAMPAKGGNTALSDADVKSAVDYMVSTAK